MSTDHAADFRNAEGRICVLCGESTHSFAGHTCGRTPDGDLPNHPDPHERDEDQR